MSGVLSSDLPVEPGVGSLSGITHGHLWVVSDEREGGGEEESVRLLNLSGEMKSGHNLNKINK